MKEQLPNHSHYPAQCTFVVHLGYAGPEDTNVLLGRAEHLLSGETTQFASWAELKAFVIRVLTQTETKPP